MNILIPYECIELTATIQRHLLFAERHGFAIDDVVIGVSRSGYFELTSQDQCTQTLTTDCTSSPPLDGANLTIYYQPLSTESVDDTQTAWVGCYQERKYYDIFNVDGLQAKIESDTPIANYRAHFCWVLSLLALDFPLQDALIIARMMDNVSRETWPSQYALFPHVLISERHSSLNQRLSFSPVDANLMAIYPVVDSCSWVEKCLAYGIKTIQLRIKNPNQHDLERQIMESIELGKRYRAQVFINDYWQLAIKHQAYGIHLGQEDLVNADLKQIAENGIRLGVSTHGYFELLNALQLSPSYIALGHIFPTTTKQMPSKPQGILRLQFYQQLVQSFGHLEKSIPTVAIGGIDLSNIKQVWKTGVDSVAVVRAITQADDPRKAIEQLHITANLRPLSQEVSYVE